MKLDAETGCGARWASKDDDRRLDFFFRNKPFACQGMDRRKRSDRESRELSASPAGKLRAGLEIQPDFQLSACDVHLGTMFGISGTTACHS
jgi:hypothetical protein